LGTAELTVARARASGLARAALDARWEALAATKIRSEYCLVGDVVEVYRREAARMGNLREKTVGDNLSALKRVVELAVRREWSGVRTSELDAAARRRFVDALTAEYTAPAGTDQDRARALARCAVTGRSYLRQAGSIFAPAWMARYEDAGLRVAPCVANWRSGPSWDRVPPLQYLRPSDEVIAGTFRLVDGLRDSEPEVYCAFWLAVGGALRRAEIADARWEWWTTVGERVLLVADRWGKGGERMQQEVLPSAVRRLAPMRRADGPILGGDPGRVLDRLAGLMRAAGWRGTKVLHELRKWSGSQIAARFGAAVAARFLRHKGVAVLEQHYLHYIPTVEFTDSTGTPFSG
jgi:integrase